MHDPAASIYQVNGHPYVRIYGYDETSGIFRIGMSTLMFKVKITYGARSSGTPELELFGDTLGRSGDVLKALPLCQEHEMAILQCLRMYLADRLEQSRLALDLLTKFLAS